MDTETTWNDDVEASDLDLVEALELDILADKSKLCQLSNEEILF